MTSDDPVTVQNPDMHIQKKVDIFDPLPGQTINYTLEVSNQGPHDAEDVWVQDTLPIGLCYVPSSTVTYTAGRSIGEPSVVPVACDGSTQQVLTRS